MGTRRARLLAGACICAAIATAGCGSSSSSSAGGSSTTSSTATKVGGPSVCDQQSMEKAVASSSASGGAQTKLVEGEFKCSGGWATAQAVVGSGQNQVQETLVFEAEGQFWIPKNRAQVCPKPSPVPAAIYKQACETN